MSKIATEQEAYNIGGKGTPITNKCVTQDRAINTFNCQVAGSYRDDQLVQLADLSKAESTQQVNMTWLYGYCPNDTFGSIEAMSFAGIRMQDMGIKGPVTTVALGPDEVFVSEDRFLQKNAIVTANSDNSFKLGEDLYNYRIGFKVRYGFEPESEFAYSTKVAFQMYAQTDFGDVISPKPDSLDKNGFYWVSPARVYTEEYPSREYYADFTIYIQCNVALSAINRVIMVLLDRSVVWES